MHVGTEQPIVKAWMPLFDQLHKDREKILIQKMTIKGKAEVFKKEEAIFFLGSLMIILTPDGIKFQLPHESAER